MKNFLRYTIASLALFAIGCHGTPNDLIVEDNKQPEEQEPTVDKGLILSVDKQTIEADGDDYVTFSLTLDGEELTFDEDKLSKIYFIHEKSGVRLERYATTFTAVKNGDYSFIATYKGQQSANSVQVKAVNREKYEPYNQKVMIYDLTGAWCPACPTMTAGLENVDPMWKSNMIVLAVHNGDQWELTEGNTDLATAMLAKFGGQGYPTCIYDLQYQNGNARTPSEIGALIESHLQRFPATCGVKIESTKLEGTTLTIEAAMTSVTGGEYEFGYAVLLDNQYYDGGTAVNGIYNDIVVAKSDNFLEMGQNKITTVADVERTKTFVIEDVKYNDTENMRVVVFVLTKRNGMVIVDNANVCKLGGSADYAGVENYNGLPEKKLTITADKNTISANGTDAVTFTVKYGNEDVSRDKSMNIIRTFNGEKMTLAAGANSFTTTVAGNYTFTARYYKGGEFVTEDEVTVVATSVESNGKQEFRHKLLGMQFTSIGCPNCRPKYHEKLKEYFAQHIDGMCEDCKARFEKNPLRLLDCKEEKCSAIAKNAPVVIEHLCDECHDHFEGLKKTLDAMGVYYQINTKIVRGLDYYTKTVFEFVYDGIGSQGTVCGGGRYDGLFEELGGNHVPAVGFGMGLERLLLTLEAEGISLGEDSVPEIFFANIGEAAKVYAFTLAEKARAEGMRAQSDLMGRSLKAQMKYADKIKAIYTVVLGDDEVANQSAVAKNMLTKEQITLDLTKPIREQLK